MIDISKPFEFTVDGANQDVTYVCSPPNDGGGHWHRVKELGSLSEGTRYYEGLVRECLIDKIWIPVEEPTPTQPKENEMIDIDKRFKFKNYDGAVFVCTPYDKDSCRVAPQDSPKDYLYCLRDLVASCLRQGFWVPIEEPAAVQPKEVDMTKAHVHADKMIQYGHDALTTEEPWKLWEGQYVGQVDAWQPLDKDPSWSPTVEYRRKPEPPRTIRIGEYDVPEPMREAPAMGSTYYSPALFLQEPVTSCDNWCGDAFDHLMIKRGFAHATEEAALLHAEALTSLSAPKG